MVETLPLGVRAVSGASLVRGSAIGTAGAGAALLLFAGLLMGSHPSERAHFLARTLPFAISIATSSFGTARALRLTGTYRRDWVFTSAASSVACWTIALLVREPLGWEVAKFACASTISGLAPAIVLTLRCRLTRVAWAYGLGCGVAFSVLPIRKLPVWDILASFLILPFGQIWLRDITFLLALALFRAKFREPTTIHRAG